MNFTENQLIPNLSLDRATQCNQLMQARRLIESYLVFRPSIGNLTLAQASEQFGSALPQNVINAIAISPYKNYTLLQAVDALGTRRGAQIFKQAVIRNSVGSLTIKQIVDQISQRFPSVQIPPQYATFGAYTLNDIVKYCYP
jgi:hypothetical protein